MIEFTKDDVWTDERRRKVQDEIESIRQYARHLTKWERSFLDSIEQFFAEHGLLTSAQLTHLHSLEDKMF